MIKATGGVGPSKHMGLCGEKKREGNGVSNRDAERKGVKEFQSYEFRTRL